MTAWLFGQGALPGVLKAGADPQWLCGAYTLQRNASVRADVANVPVYNFKSLTACEAAPPPGFTWALYSQDSTSENSLWEMSHIGEAHERACALLHTQGLEVLTFRPTTLSGRRRPLRIATNTRRSSDATSRAMRLDTQTPSACSRRD